MGLLQLGKKLLSQSTLVLRKECALLKTAIRTPSKAALAIVMGERSRVPWSPAASAPWPYQ